jgi:3-(3-hydroxy-phenyl)propionate hydroxylase
MPMDQNLPVIICGAGPAGMTAALFLARAGVPVHVLERNLEIFDDPRDVRRSRDHPDAA